MLSQPPDTNDFEPQDDVDTLIEHSDLLIQGKLLKHLKKKGYSELHSLNIYSDVAQVVADIDADSVPDGDLYRATWHKIYGKLTISPLALLFSFIPAIGLFLGPIRDEQETYKFETTHRLRSSEGRRYWLRYLLIGLVQLFAAVVFVLSSMTVLFVTFVTIFDYNNIKSDDGLLVVIIVLTAVAVISITSGTLYYQAARRVLPKSLRLYANKGFKLKRLKRVE